MITLEAMERMRKPKRPGSYELFDCFRVAPMQEFIVPSIPNCVFKILPDGNMVCTRPEIWQYMTYWDIMAQADTIKRAGELGGPNNDSDSDNE